MAVRVNVETFAAEVLQAKGLVLVDFYSDSCVPCKRIAPLLSEVAAADPDGLKVVKVNINFDAELAEQYAVQAAPRLFPERCRSCPPERLGKKSRIDRSH